MLEVARIRRLGSVGEVSAPAEELCVVDLLQIWVVTPAACGGFPARPDPIVSTQRLPMRGDWILSTSTQRLPMREDRIFIYTEMRRAGGNEFFDLDYGLTYFAPYGARTRGLGLIRPTL